MNKTNIIQQISLITTSLIEMSLSVNQNYPSEKDNLIYISGKYDQSIALKNISYEEIYNILEKENNYNIKMIDGALIQMMYTFDNTEQLLKYRLAFFPSPDLEEFQNNEEIYNTDEIYADVIDKNIVTAPIRFDYDPKNHIPVDHPKSHVTIGQYKNCRIPVSIPLTPIIFIDFILRNFYNTAFKSISPKLRISNFKKFDRCINDNESKLLHMNILS